VLVLLEEDLGECLGLRQEDVIDPVQDPDLVLLQEEDLDHLPEALVLPLEGSQAVDVLRLCTAIEDDFQKGFGFSCVYKQGNASKMRVMTIYKSRDISSLSNMSVSHL